MGHEGRAKRQVLFALDVQDEAERNRRVQHFTVTEEFSSLYECVIDVRPRRSRTTPT